MPAGRGASQGQSQVVMQAGGKKRFERKQGPGDAIMQVVPTNSKRLALLIYNAGNGTVYMGGDDVDAFGYPLPSGAQLVDNDSLDAWYANGDGTAIDLRIIETVMP